MQKSFRLFVAAALIGLGVWGWRVLSPSPQSVIRSRLHNLAATVSYEAKDGMILKGYKAQKIPDFFTSNAVITVDVRGYDPQTWQGSAELPGVFLALTREVAALKAGFPDINVSLGPDAQTAVVNLTARVVVQGERDPIAQEFNFLMKKTDGKWLIYRIETVRTLSRAHLRRSCPPQVCA
jgi:hypothetical protein